MHDLEFFSYFDSLLSLEQNKRKVNMNVLERLIIEWMSTYAGFGLMAEQGNEAIHACSFQQAV